MSPAFAFSSTCAALRAPTRRVAQTGTGKRPGYGELGERGPVGVGHRTHLLEEGQDALAVLHAELGGPRPGSHPPGAARSAVTLPVSRPWASGE